MGAMLSAAGSLQWFRETLGSRDGYEALVAEAERWAPTVEGMSFLPYLAGERTPHADPHARGAFTGLSLRHDRGALVRAVLEGVAYGLRDSVEILRQLGVEPTVGRVSGGGARSALWSEFSPPSCSFHSSGPRSMPVRRSVRRCSQGSRRASSPMSTKRSSAASESAASSSPIRSGLSPTTPGTTAFVRSIPALRPLEAT